MKALLKWWVMPQRVEREGEARKRKQISWSVERLVRRNKTTKSEKLEKQERQPSKSMLKGLTAKQQQSFEFVHGALGHPSWSMMGKFYNSGTIMELPELETQFTLII